MYFLRQIYILQKYFVYIPPRLNPAPTVPILYPSHVIVCTFSASLISTQYANVLSEAIRLTFEEESYAARLLPCVLKGQSGSKRPPTFRSILTKSSPSSKRQSTLSPNVALQGCRRVSLCDALIVSSIQLGIRSAHAANCASGIPSKCRSCRWSCPTVQSSAAI